MSALVWSEALERVFRREILEPIKRRSQWPDFWLGVPLKEIQPLVLEMGRADFRQSFTHPKYGVLTPEDRVLLYCFLVRLAARHSVQVKYPVEPSGTSTVPTEAELRCGKHGGRRARRAVDRYSHALCGEGGGAGAIVHVP